VDQRYLRNRRVMWGLFALLVILHHDWWLWNDGRLVFGFLPIGLGYQMLISLAAGALWGWAAFYAWPHEMEDSAAGPDAAIVPDAAGAAGIAQLPSHR
jgi:hypothetical protein